MKVRMKTECMDIEIVEYRDDLAEALAHMYNTWDTLWPTGYTRGVPYTAERVRKELGTMNAISILIAIDRQSGRPVGSCTLHAHMRDTDAAYIGVLGVSPEALNKRVGKRLLLRAIEVALERGYGRVDLNTWAGNLRAVPLYKRVGMMWNPEGMGVTMEDYVPAILAHPLCRGFFSGTSPDEWYSLLRREIKQAPDDLTVDGMRVYEYRFERGDDTLTVRVDRHCKAISSVESVVSGKRLRVSTRLAHHDVQIGLKSRHILEIVNGTDQQLKVAASLKVFDGISLDGVPSAEFTVEPGDQVTWVVTLRPDDNAPLSVVGKRTPAIITSLVIDGLVCELSTGPFVQPIAEIVNEENECIIGPGGDVILPLSILSSADMTLRGKIELETSQAGLTISPSSADIVLSPRGRAGAMIHVVADTSLPHGAYSIRARLRLEPDRTSPDAPIVTGWSKLRVFCLADMRAAVSTDEVKREVVVASVGYIARLQVEGGALIVYSPIGSMDSPIFRASDVGPPFGIGPLRQADRIPRIAEDPHQTTVVMSVDHPERPLRLEDRYIFEHNGMIVRHEIWVENTGSVPETIQARATGRLGGIGLSPGVCYVPLEHGVVRNDLSDITFSYPVIPSDPTRFSEGWFAVERTQSYALGQFWKPSAVEEVQLAQDQVGNVVFPSTTLPPRESRKVGEIWMVFGARDWREVQQIWRHRVVGVVTDGVVKSGIYPLMAPVDVLVRPAVIPHLRETDVTIKLATRRGPTVVSLTVEPPEGWSCDPQTISELRLDGESDLSVVLTPSDDVPRDRLVHRGRVRLTAAVERVVPLRVIQLGHGGSLQVVGIEREGLEVFQVTTDACEFQVSAEYGGCMISLRNSSKTEFLKSSFPTPTPREGGFMENYYGGVQPIIWSDSPSDGLTRARTNRENMVARMVEIGCWRGVEVSWKSVLQRIIRGMDVAVQYLTCAGSPLVLVRMLLRNSTASPTAINPSFMTDIAIDTSPPGWVMRTDWLDGRSDVYLGSLPIAAAPSSRVLLVRRGGPICDSVAMIADPEQSRVIGVCFQDMLMLGAFGKMLVLPGEHRELVLCLAVNICSDEDLLDVQNALREIANSVR
ncbi:MAG: GNAT family N-acetyltransferase [Candidatus Thorarchaeota archaeon]